MFEDVVRVWKVAWSFGKLKAVCVLLPAENDYIKYCSGWAFKPLWGIGFNLFEAGFLCIDQVVLELRFTCQQELGL